ncbi:flagellar hook-length control protein FliK [Pararhizobium sp. LjRoot238]|uniref:flagellar hook-length control protein FliK n=1 Tax=Pararhizobium sp. LjRoot238 TaxID=3342293 RepID=UPI003ECF327D
MTFVDDSLLGTAPIRSAKSGSKSGGKQNEAEAVKQRSAFENAFADAGKKKQPMISISGKIATDTGTQALTTAVTMTDTVSNGDTAAIDPDNSLSLPGSADDGEMKSALASTTDAAFRSAAKQMPMPQAGEEFPVEQEAHGQTFALTTSEGLLASIGFANLGADATAGAGQILDEQAGDKMKALLKDPKAQLSKHSDSEAATSDGAMPSNSQGNADAAMDTAPADVSHLLALLGAAQKPTDAGTTVPAETTPVLSEFQALAESAGNAKVGSKDAAAAKPEARAVSDDNAVNNATQAGSSDQVFRFARADGKGQAVSMSLASDGDKAVVKNDAADSATTTAKAETVTVVEARRYLGLAPSSNASAVTSQIASNPEWANALQPSTTASAPLTEASTGKVLNTLKIQMHPIDLGAVTATLRLKDDELHVELKVETGDAFRQLSDDQSAMVKALRAQGFAVDQVNVVFNAPDSSSGNSTQQQAQPQTGQHGREAAGDGPAQGRGQRNDSGSQEQGGGRWTGNEGTSDASSGAEPGRTGDVYM